MKKGARYESKVLVIWLLTKILRVYIVEKTVSLTNGSGEAGYEHAENKTGCLSLLYKSQLQTRQRSLMQDTKF